MVEDRMKALQALGITPRIGVYICSLVFNVFRRVVLCRLRGTSGDGLLSLENIVRRRSIEQSGPVKMRNV